MNPSFVQIKNGVPDLHLLKKYYLLYFWNLPLFYHSIDPRDYGPVLQILKVANIATSFVFTVLTLEAVSDHKRSCSVKVKVFRISVKLKVFLFWLGYCSLYHSSTSFHKKDRKRSGRKSWIIPYRNSNNLAEAFRTSN